MYAISECVTCVVLTLTSSAFLFAFCVVVLTIKDGLENRRGTSPAFQKFGRLTWARPVAVVARPKRSGR